MLFDARLTQLGVQQAIAARAEVAELGIRYVVSSPMTRAIETARHIFEGKHPHHIAIGPHELLTHSCDVGRPATELAAEFPELDFSHLPEIWWHQGQVNNNGIPVETREVFSARIKAFANQMTQFEQRPVAIVCHANVIEELIGEKVKNCEVRLYPV